MSICSTSPSARVGICSSAPRERRQRGGAVPVDFKEVADFRRLGPSRHEVVDFPVVAPSCASSGAADVVPAAAAARRRAVRRADGSCATGAVRAGQRADRRAVPGALPARTDRRTTCGRRGASLRTTCSRWRGRGFSATAGGDRTQSDRPGPGGCGGWPGSDAAARLHPMRVVVAPLAKRRYGEDRLLVSFFDRPVGVGEAGGAAGCGKRSPPPGSWPRPGKICKKAPGRWTTANEELQASNEEIRLINEELQASMGRARDLQGGAAVAERGADHGQPPASGEARGAGGPHRRPAAIS